MTSHHRNQWWLSLPTHSASGCVTRPQWVKVWWFHKYSFWGCSNDSHVCAVAKSPKRQFFLSLSHTHTHIYIYTLKVHTHSSPMYAISHCHWPCYNGNPLQLCLLIRYDTFAELNTRWSIEVRTKSTFLVWSVTSDVSHIWHMSPLCLNLWNMKVTFDWATGASMYAKLWKKCEVEKGKISISRPILAVRLISCLPFLHSSFYCGFFQIVHYKE